MKNEQESTPMNVFRYLRSIRGLSRQEVLDRMNNQMSREDRLNRECTVIDNSGTIEETNENVRRELEKLRSEMED